MDPNLTGLPEKFVSGSVWMVGLRVAERVLGLLSIVILARLLTPEDYGIVALALTTLAILENGLFLGFEAALIKFQDANRSEYDTAWTLNALRGVVVAIILVLASVLSEPVFKEPRLAGVFLLLALAPLFEGVVNIGVVEFRKKIEFNKEVYYNLSARGVGVAVTIAVAVVWQTYWAIVIGAVLGRAVKCGLSYALHPYRPGIATASWRKLVAFSGWLSANNLITTLSMRIDVFLVNAFLGPKVVGAYHVGSEVGQMPHTQLTAPVMAVLFPSLASFGNDHARMASAYLKGLSGLIAVGLPVSVGLALVAEEFVPVVFGQKWDQAIPVLQVISSIMAAHLVTSGFESVAMAKGMTRMLFNRQVVASTIRPAFLFAGLYYYGLWGALGGRAAAAAVMVCINIGLMRRVLDRPYARILTAGWRSWISAAAMIVAVLAVKNSLPWPDTTFPIFALAGEMIVGAIVYISVHLALWRLAGRPDGFETMALDMTKRTLFRRRAIG